MHVFVQEEEGCMVCCYNPDGLRLPVIWFFQGMMSHDKHMHDHLATMLHTDFSSLQYKRKSGC